MAFKVNPRDSFAKSKLLKGFKSSTVGQYDPRCQIITLNRYDGNDFRNLKNADESKQKEFMAVVIHEFAHWIDHVSSLWGQRKLLAWLNGVAAWRNGDETQYSAVLEARQALKTIKYAEYFTTVEITDMAEARKAAPWTYRYTAGKAFDLSGKLNTDHPILFTRFETRDGTPIGRFPMSAGALLELNAIAADVWFDILRVRAASDIVDERIRENDFKNKYLDILYSPELAEYSVAAHCFSNSIKTPDIVQAYRKGACLSELAMNLPSHLFERVRLPKRCEKFAELHPHFLKRGDAGYVYWCLCKNAVPDEDVSLEQWTEMALSNSGLPDRNTIKKEAVIEMKGLLGKAPAGTTGDRLRELVRYGTSVFERHGVSRIRNIYEIYQEAHTEGRIPLTLLGDNTLVGNSQAWQTVKPSEIEEWHQAMWDFDAWSETFESACIS